MFNLYRSSDNQRLALPTFRLLTFNLYRRFDIDVPAIDVLSVHTNSNTHNQTIENNKFKQKDIVLLLHGMREIQLASLTSQSDQEYELPLCICRRKGQICINNFWSIWFVKRLKNYTNFIFIYRKALQIVLAAQLQLEHLSKI